MPVSYIKYGGSLFLVLASLKANFNIFYEFITQSLFADLRFVSIYLWQNKRIGENDPSLMRQYIETKRKSAKSDCVINS
jgi:hypothetical protein